MSVNRRDFLKIAGAAGSALVAGGGIAKASTGAAGNGNGNDVEFYGMLIDTTKCVGCRSCEEACNQANKLPPPKESFSDESVLEKPRDTTPDAFTVINKYPNEKEPDKPIFARKQCMHCNQPACASACLVKALQKTPEGPTIYNKDRCMGCRYCMVSCPYDIPKFQYDSPLPYIRKCIFCYSRVKAGEKPACAEACPEGATLFGKKRDLMEEARTRIYQNPDKYYHKIYGEHDAGGTSFLYLSAVPFEKIGFKKDVGTQPYPEMTSGFLYGVPLVFVLWPSLLYGLSLLTKGKEKESEHGS
jgi:formate dehydrogenase iron-sulfur subunit